MANKDEAAFPIPQEEFGLTKREYFAVLALQGLLSNNYETGKGLQEFICEEAIRLSDILLKKLSEREAKD